MSRRVSCLSPFVCVYIYFSLSHVYRSLQSVHRSILNMISASYVSSRFLFLECLVYKCPWRDVCIEVGSFKVSIHISMSHIPHINSSFSNVEDSIQIWMSHIPPINSSFSNVANFFGFAYHLSIFDAYEWVMSHVWLGHVTHVKESCQTSGDRRHERYVTYQWVMSHMWTNHVTQVTESYYKWAMSYMNISYHTYKGVMAHIGW